MRHFRYSGAAAVVATLLGAAGGAAAAEDCAGPGTDQAIRVAIHLVESERICPEGFGSGSPCTGIDGVAGLDAQELEQIATDQSLVYACQIPPTRLVIAREKPVTTRSFEGALDTVQRIGRDISLNGPMSALLIITWPGDEASPLHEHNGEVTLRRFNVPDALSLPRNEPPREGGHLDSTVETYSSPSRSNAGHHQYYNYQRGEFLHPDVPTAWQVLIAGTNDGGSVELVLRNPSFPPDAVDPAF